MHPEGKRIFFSFTAPPSLPIPFGTFPASLPFFGAGTYLLNARWMVSAALLEASGPPYFLCSTWSCFSAKSALSGYRSIAAAATTTTKVAREEEEEAETVRGHVRHSEDVHDALSLFHIIIIVVGVAFAGGGGADHRRVD